MLLVFHLASLFLWTSAVLLNRMSHLEKEARETFFCSFLGSTVQLIMCNCSAMQNFFVPNSTIQNSTVQTSAAQISTVPTSPVQISTVHFFTAQTLKMQFFAIQTSVHRISAIPYLHGQI